MKKESQKWEFSLGNIGESPRNEKCARHVVHHHSSRTELYKAAILMGDSPMLSFKMGDSPMLSFKMRDLPRTFFIFGGFTYVTCGKFPFLTLFFKIDVAPNFH